MHRVHRFTGYDACGHMSEETRSADKYAPWGIVLAIGCSAGVGFLYVLAMMLSIQNPSDLFTGNPATAPLGNANGYIAGAHAWGSGVPLEVVQIHIHCA